MIVTIDGPAGSGKSTAARRLAQRLEFEYLDTGAMYRAVAWYCLHQSVDPSDAAGVSEAARSLQVRLKGETVMANDVDVTEAIRSPHITQAASLVATHPAVRSQMVCEQRRLARNRNIVVEGRDQGTVVFPNAECKFFLVADATERARRRFRELENSPTGRSVGFSELLQQIQQRDQRDEERSDSPLKPADDALLIDTTSLTESEVVGRLEQIVRRRQSDVSA